jgi:ribosomal protein S18 acetylase RimI-like enzyme
MAPVSIFKLIPADVLPLQTLARSTFIESFAEQNSPEQLADYVARAFNEAQLLEELQRPGSTFYALSRGDEWLGYLKINTPGAQSDLQLPNSLEIERIYLLQQVQGKGYGRLLLDMAIQQARLKGFQRVWLGVWEHNTKAIAFYERHGFRKFDEHVFTMGNEAQCDWLMVLELG